MPSNHQEYQPDITIKTEDYLEQLEEESTASSRVGEACALLQQKSAEAVQSAEWEPRKGSAGDRIEAAARSREPLDPSEREREGGETGRRGSGDGARSQQIWVGELDHRVWYIRSRLHSRGGPFSPPSLLTGRPERESGSEWQSIVPFQLPRSVKIHVPHHILLKVF